jgi:hypothetical protein
MTANDDPSATATSEVKRDDVPDATGTSQPAGEDPVAALEAEKIDLKDKLMRASTAQRLPSMPTTRPSPR